MYTIWLSIVLWSIEGVLASSIPRVAVAYLSANNVQGNVTFTETTTGVRVTGIIEGMEPGFYGFHIHELGDMRTCDTTGAHYNPEGVTHGGRNHSVRHVGDLGNVQFSVNSNSSTSNFSFLDDVVALRGKNNILGRSVVLHAERDDYGQGGTDASLATGNAGARVACGVIGMHAPVDAWNSVATVIPSTVVLIFIAVINLLN